MNRVSQTFTEFLNEMAFVSGKLGKLGNLAHSRENDWNNFYKKDAKLIVDKLPKGYRIYQHGSNYFLVDIEDNYLGYVQLNDVSNSFKNILSVLTAENIYQVTSSNQNGSVKGFYNIIFTSIFTHTGVEAIMSDDNLSSNAVTSYDKLNKISNLGIYLYTQTTKELSSFEKDTLTNVNSSVVVIAPKNNKLKETWSNYINKITTNLSYINEYYDKCSNELDKNDTLYMFLFTNINGIPPTNEFC